MMKKFWEILKGARRIEWFLIAIAVAILLLLMPRPGSTGAHTEIETRLAGILGRIDGVGRVEVMIAQDAEGAPAGVLVVAEGAEDIRTSLKLEMAVKTLLGTEVSRIEIVHYGQ